MDKLEIGQVINTHGVRGELKCELWTDPQAVLPRLKEIRLGEEERQVLSWRVHKGFLLLRLGGIEDMDTANSCRGRTVWVPRQALKQETGFFFGDLFGFTVHDARTGRDIGTLTAVEELPRGYVYVVTTPEGEEVLIPARPEFEGPRDVENRRMELRTLEGMLPDEN